MTERVLTAERLRTVLSYDHETGIFLWKVALSRCIKVGAVAGARHVEGYLVIWVDGRSYKAHRLAWLYVHGEWPPRLDHEDGVKNNNRLANLRVATYSQNSANTGRYRNNTSGFKGVHFLEGKWAAQIRKEGKKHYLGRYETPQAAHDVYCKAAEAMFGTFARTA